MNLSDIEYWIGIGSIWIVLAPIIAGLFYFFKLSKESLIILGLTFLAALPQVTRAFTSESVLLNVLYNSYTPLEFLLLFFLFRTKIRNSRSLFLFNFLAIIYSLLSPVLIHYYGFNSRFNNQWVCVNNFIYTVWLMLIIVDQYETRSKDELNSQTPFFWYFLGVLLYAPCTLLVFLFWKYLRGAEEPFLVMLKLIHHVFNFLMYLFFLTGIFKDVNSSRQRLIKEMIL